jgi:transposase
MRDIAAQARCSVSLVHNVLSNFREFGTTVNPFKRYTGRSRYLDEEDMLYLTTLLKANPSLNLDELQLKLADARDVHVSIATLSRALASIQISKKARDGSRWLISFVWLWELGQVTR